MTLEEYEEAAQKLLNLAGEIERRKRPSYTGGNPDVLHNFRRDGDELGIGAFFNWATHFQKQAAAIVRWSKAPYEEQSEPIEQRLADVINYCKLGFALYIEGPKNKTASDATFMHDVRLS